MVALHPNVRFGGYETADDPSPKSMRRTAALAANPLPYIARAVVVALDGDITVTREDGSSDIVWCAQGWNPIRFTRLEADAGTIVKDVHF